MFSEFAPKMMSEGEIKQAVNDVIAKLGISAPSAKDKGVIMKSFMPIVRGKADGSLVNRLVSDMFK